MQELDNIKLVRSSLKQLFSLQVRWNILRSIDKQHTHATCIFVTKDFELRVSCAYTGLFLKSI